MTTEELQRISELTQKRGDILLYAFCAIAFTGALILILIR